MTVPSAQHPTSFHLFTGRDVPWLVDERARTHPDKVFLIWEPFTGAQRTWTFAQFARETAAYAAGLAAWGVGKGDFVAIHLDNCPEFLFAWYGCSRLGAVAVTTNTRSTEDELGYFLAHSRAVAVITQPCYLETVRASAPQIERVACIADDAGEASSVASTAGAVAFESLRGAPEAAPRRAAEALLPNSVQYTSGTTSRPKGVVWTHANALWSGRTTAAHAGLTDRDIHLVHLPLFHTAALGYSVLGTLWSAGTVVLMPRFSASRFWDIAVRNRCTWTFAVGFHVRALSTLPAPEKHAFEFWLAGGDIALVRERWGIKTIGWYGMTETIAQTITYSRDLVGPEFSMGRPASEYENAIRRADGSEVDFGETGHLWVRGVAGVTLFQEYLRDPTATAAAFDPDGWFSTGDLVTPRENGFVFFASRDKDMLKVGGENVAAIEIESVIARVPGVVEVAVVGRTDPVYDEVPVACVVASAPGAELEHAIMEACRLKLSKFKQPRQVVFLDELPKGLIDKVLKRELRKYVLALISQSD
jgi:crotonobetaine/carnitine-CoA ligase